MRAIIPALFMLALAASAARAHAFLDHAIPSVGNAVVTPPTTIRIWFTQELPPPR